LKLFKSLNIFIIMNNRIKLEYEQVKEMRKDKVAPVDIMGCHLFKDNTLEKHVSDFHVLVAALLSSQTKDVILYPAMQRLREKGLTIDNILQMKLDDLAAIIKPVGFYNKKAERLQKICTILKEKYNYQPPISYDSLIKLPGIGPKMAYLILNIVNGEPHGICVDTHVHRIANRIGWVDTKTPEKTRKELEKIVDKSCWIEINPLLVGFGQSICKSKKPSCTQCLLKESCIFFKNI
jgi:endonuclease-3